MPVPLLVFVQHGQLASAPSDAALLTAYGERFFATRLGLAEPMAGDPVLGTRWVVAPERRSTGIRTVWIRPREAADVERARVAEERGGATGLALLAARCTMAWLIERDGVADTIALRLAAIVAGVGLGPILEPDAPALFGVRTARARLAALESA